MFLDGLGHGYTREGSLEANSVVAYLYFGGAVHVEAYLLEHALGKIHHPVVEVDETMGKGKIIDEIFGEKCEGLYIQPTFITTS